MRRRAALKREEVKFYLRDVLLVDAKQLETYKPDSILSFWCKNYRQLRRDSYPRLRSMDFNSLLDVELSSDFFVRFPRIKELTATGSVERDQFERFLKNANALRSLRLIDTSLDQPSMERLPSINRRLIALEINANSDLVANFNFILKFKRLADFQTNRQLNSSELAEKAFWQLKRLMRFQYQTGNERVKIYRCSARDQVAFDFEIGNMQVPGNNKIFRCSWLAEGTWPMTILESGWVRARIFWPDPPWRISRCLINRPYCEQSESTISPFSTSNELDEW